MTRRYSGLAFALATLMVLCGCTTTGRPPIIDGSVLIEDVTVVSPESAAPLYHTDVGIRAGRIAGIGKNLRAGAWAQRINGRGRFLIPGLVDSHVHIGHVSALDDIAIDSHPGLLSAYRAQVPRSYLAFGFTTVVDLDLEQSDSAWFEAAPLRPNLMHCGRGVRTAGGYGAQRVTADSVMRRDLNLVYEQTQAANWPQGLDPADYTPARAVQRARDAGAKCLKIFYEPGFGGTFHWPVPSAGTMRALRSQAKTYDLPVLVHATGVEGWKAGIEARVNIIAHGLWYWNGNPAESDPPPEARAVIEAAARAGVAVQPTLQVLYGEDAILDPSVIDDPRYQRAMPRSIIAYLRNSAAQQARREVAQSYLSGVNDFPAMLKTYQMRAQRTLQLMVKSNITLLLGSDTPAGDGVEGIGNPPGLNGRVEMERWSDAGVPLARILRAATLDNARALGIGKELGSIEVGKKADLLLLGADPFSSIAAYDSIETIFVGGMPVTRDALLPTN